MPSTVTCDLHSASASSVRITCAGRGVRVTSVCYEVCRSGAGIVCCTCARRGIQFHNFSILRGPSLRCSSTRRGVRSCSSCRLRSASSRRGLHFTSASVSPVAPALAVHAALALVVAVHQFTRLQRLPCVLLPAPVVCVAPVHVFARASHFSLTASMSFDGALDVDVTECHRTDCGALPAHFSDALQPRADQRRRPTM